MNRLALVPLSGLMRAQNWSFCHDALRQLVENTTVAVDGVLFSYKTNLKRGGFFLLLKPVFGLPDRESTEQYSWQVH